LNVAYEDRGVLRFAVRAGESTTIVELGQGVDPSLAFTPLGVYMAYSGPAPGEGTERRILLATRLGGQWTPGATLSSGPGDDRSPSLALWDSDVPTVAWERHLPSGPTRVWFRRAGFAPVLIGDGDRPVLLLDRAGRAQVIYRSDGRIVRRREGSSARPGVFGDPQTIATPSAGDFSFAAALSSAQSVHVAWSDGGRILVADDTAGPFSPPLAAASAGASSPSIHVSDSGARAIAFEEDGDIRAALGTTFFLPASVPVTDTPASEAKPAVLLDSFANLFVVFLRGSELYFATDAGVPQARFSAEPSTGEAPLDVRFVDESVGTVTGWDWDFGDGSVSRDRNPSHTFEETGEYTVSLAVSGPGGESPVAFRGAVRVLDSRNDMSIPKVRAFPGQKGVHIPVLASHDEPAQGLTVAATYDPDVLDVRSCEFRETNIDGLSPELFAATVSNDPADPYIVVGVLFDVLTPIDGRVLLPGRDQRVLNIVVDVKPTVLPGTVTRVELQNQLGHPPLNNILTVNGFTVLPVLRRGGEVEISHLRFPPPRFFLRGDSNGDRGLNVADVVTTLNHLFAGGESPDCDDAADSNDNGAVDISDAVATLNFLFRAGSSHPPPFPDLGLDPTDDELAPCLLR
ncbi:MAG: PKD domain-containing protein, partial [Candidatus Methanoperedens sp.]|nr:PKD domain-containing protein [Candidatus Methanoperedens sp.]